MKTSVRMVLAIVLLLLGGGVDCFSQVNKDSLRLELYKKGLISPELYHDLRPRHDVMAENRQSIMNLRAKLRYKFALDYLLFDTSEGRKAFWNDTSAICSWYPEYFQVVPNDSSRKDVLERFVCGSEYALMQVSGFTGDRKYYLLMAVLGDNVMGFDLLADDTSHAKFLDEYNFDRVDGKVAFDTLNGHPFMRVNYANWITGRRRDFEAYLGIIDGKITTLFKTIRAEITAPPESDSEERFTCMLSKLSLADLDHDGFLDIEEDLILEVMPLADFRMIDSAYRKSKDINELYKVQPEQVVWERVNRYYWNEKTLWFDKRE